MEKIRTDAVFFIVPLKPSGILDIWSFLIIFVKLFGYKDSGVRNLQKIEYFYGYFRHSRNA